MSRTQKMLVRPNCTGGALSADAGDTSAESCGDPLSTSSTGVSHLRKRRSIQSVKSPLPLMSRLAAFYHRLARENNGARHSPSKRSALLRTSELATPAGVAGFRSRTVLVAHGLAYRGDVTAGYPASKLSAEVRVRGKRDMEVWIQRLSKDVPCTSNATHDFAVFPSRLPILHG